MIKIKKIFIRIVCLGILLISTGCFGSYNLTVSDYNSLKTGMTIQEVSEYIYGECPLMSESTDSFGHMEMYTCDLDDGSTAILTFVDNELFSKQRV